MVRIGVTFALLSLTLSGRVFAAGGVDDAQTEIPPPVFVAGGRTVETRNSSGGLTRQSSIPGDSAFATFGGGDSATCQFTAEQDGETSDGTPYVAGQVVISTRFVFREVPSSFSPEPSLADNTMHGVSSGPLAEAVRYFAVFCDSRFDLVGAAFPVSVNDPLLDPRPYAADLYNHLQLERPVVYRNPVVDTWGGLVTRFPTWLAVRPSAWRVQKSLPDYYLGWTLLLLTEPSALEFEVHFLPNPDKPSDAFSGVVACVAAPGAATADSVAFPAMPELPEQSPPGVNGACMWTPPGPGSVTIQARITYAVTFWANGYTEPMADYVWTSEPVTFVTGELAVVNTNG